MANLINRKARINIESICKTGSHADMPDSSRTSSIGRVAVNEKKAFLCMMTSWQYMTKTAFHTGRKTHLPVSLELFSKQEGNCIMEGPAGSEYGILIFKTVTKYMVKEESDDKIELDLFYTLCDDHGIISENNIKMTAAFI